MIKLSIDDLTSFHDQGPHLQTLAESAHARVLLACLRPGQALKDHTTPCQVAIHVVRGTARVHEAGRSTEAREGELVIVPAGSRHRVEAAAETVLLISLSPHPAASKYPAEHRDRIVSQVPHQAV
ncbi:MAG TPA: cupin domain-containing protein [Candidatus Saccharimonadales bacterium]|nr:cupin domain-containing protein [Candidatus Saccharimonadales bacterium]